MTIHPRVCDDRACRHEAFVSVRRSDGAIQNRRLFHVRNRPRIHRCTVCGDEIGIAKWQTLPSEETHQHDLDPPSDPLLDPGPTAWQLIAAAESRH